IDAAAAATDALSCPGVWDGTTCEVLGVVGQYQAGFFPIMMFGLPGAALAIYLRAKTKRRKAVGALMMAAAVASFFTGVTERSEEHTSELQSRFDLVCRLLLEKKNEHRVE